MQIFFCWRIILYCTLLVTYVFQGAFGFPCVLFNRKFHQKKWKTAFLATWEFLFWKWNIILRVMQPYAIRGGGVTRSCLVTWLFTFICCYARLFFNRGKIYFYFSIHLYPATCCCRISIASKVSHFQVRTGKIFLKPYHPPPLSTPPPDLRKSNVRGPLPNSSAFFKSHMSVFINFCMNENCQAYTSLSPWI